MMNTQIQLEPLSACMMPLKIVLRKGPPKELGPGIFTLQM